MTTLLRAIRAAEAECIRIRRLGAAPTERPTVPAPGPVRVTIRPWSPPPMAWLGDDDTTTLRPTAPTGDER